MTRVGRRRRRGRRPGIRHRQVEHVPLALGRVRVAAAASHQVNVPVYISDTFSASRLQQSSAVVCVQLYFNLGGTRRREDPRAGPACQLSWSNAMGTNAMGTPSMEPEESRHHQQSTLSHIDYHFTPFRL